MMEPAEAVYAELTDQLGALEEIVRRLAALYDQTLHTTNVPAREAAKAAHEAAWNAMLLLQASREYVLHNLERE